MLNFRCDLLTHLSVYLSSVFLHISSDWLRFVELKLSDFYFTSLMSSQHHRCVLLLAVRARSLALTVSLAHLHSSRRQKETRRSKYQEQEERNIISERWRNDERTVSRRTGEPLSQRTRRRGRMREGNSHIGCDFGDISQAK